MDDATTAPVPEPIRRGVKRPVGSPLRQPLHQGPSRGEGPFGGRIRCACTKCTALAADEGPHHNPVRVATTATRSGDAWTLTGHKSFVLDGHVADLLIVSARAPEGQVRRPAE